jgi:hypothetical protein
MSLKLIYEGKATLEDLYFLNDIGYEFVVEDGRITEILGGNAR